MGPWRKTLRRTAPRPDLQSGWLSGLVLGFLSGIALMSFGAFGLALLAASVLLIAWQGPRLVATAGLLAGAGLLWTVLFLKVALSCAATNATSGERCDPGSIWSWAAVAAAIFMAGLFGSSLAFRWSRRRP